MASEFVVVVLLQLLSFLTTAHIIMINALNVDPCFNLNYTYHPSETLPHGRWSFPDDFLFGTSTASYQIEGAANQSCRGPSIWDRFAHQFPERIADGSNGDVAIDHYHLFQEDIKRMKAMNVDAYRFSVSWSRVIPYGKISAGVNKEGIQFYHNLIDSLKANGIEPFVTIFHWDTPQALEAEYGGFLSRNILKDFEDYCELLFKEYGDKVKKWISLNEPSAYALKGYDEGMFAPGRCSVWVDRACLAGDSATEPYIVTHHLLLAHANAYCLYQNKYKTKQKGEFGITLVNFWYVPYSNATADILAAQRAMDFQFGWYMDPITYGRYPRSMVDLVGSRLPAFTEEESLILKKSYDFLGLNYYTAYYAKNITAFDPLKLRYTDDWHANITERDSNGTLIGEKLGSDWQYLYPDGIRQLMEYTKTKYQDPVIYITENGMAEADDPKESLAEARNDSSTRINFYIAHLEHLRQAMIEKEVKVKGFFAWSYADNYEWRDGYTMRFGLNYINYTDLSRHPKHSACWYANFCDKNHTKTTTTTAALDLLLTSTTTRSSSSASPGGRRALIRPTPYAN